MDLIIKNAKIINADKTYSADIGIKNEKIAIVQKNLKPDTAEIIEKYTNPLVFSLDLIIFPHVF